MMCAAAHSKNNILCFVHGQVVEWLNYFCNFSESVDSLLNNAARTQGADHFSDFRSFKFFGKEREVNGQLKTVGVMQCHANYR